MLLLAVLNTGATRVASRRREVLPSARRLTSEMSEEQGEDSEENTEAPATFIEAAFPSTPLGGENMPRLQEPSSPRPLDVQYRVDPTTQLNRPEWSLFCWIVRRS